jgi:hypothetical protein
MDRKTPTAALLCLLAVGLTNCKDKAPPPTPVAASSSSTVPAPATPAITRPTLKGGGVEAGRSSDGGPWFEAFKFSWPDGAPMGATWLEARKSCESVGLDLCTQEQWTMACAKDPDVGKAESWTITHASGPTWVVRGGTGCASTADSPENVKKPERIGLCCERRAGITANSKNTAILKSGHVYIDIIEKAANSGSPEQIVKLLAEESLLYKTRMTRQEALADLKSDMQKWPRTNTRFVSCNVEIPAQEGQLDCSAVTTRVSGEGTTELSVFRSTFKWGSDFKYYVFGEPGVITRKWGPVDK